MMKSAITISLVPEARRGPFVFHANEGKADLFAYCKMAAEMGFEYVVGSTDLSQTIKLVDRMDTAIVDAYLSPIIKAYIAELEATMPEGRLRLMTSAGALASSASAPASG